MMRHPGLPVLGLSFLVALGSACEPGCDDPVVFTVLPVDLASVTWVTPIGNMGPPTHTIPTDHVGLYLNGTGIPLVAPSALTIKEVRRTTYLVSPFRQGESDYSITGRLCQDHQLTFGHIQTVVPAIDAAVGSSDCQTYSTATETVQTCRNKTDIPMDVGAAIGTVGGPSAGAFDFGVYDNQLSNYFVNPSRYSEPTRTAICPYEPFTAGLKSQLFALIGDGVRTASGESPECGSMSVDLAGTARGVWVLQSDPVNQQGDETNFAVLAPHPLFPVTKQTFALGPAALNATSGPGQDTYPLVVSGRVNRPFGDITADGLIYCYVYDAAAATWSYFVRLAAGPVLTIEKVAHAAGATPCGGAPATWSFSGGALAFIR